MTDITEENKIIAFPESKIVRKQKPKKKKAVNFDDICSMLESDIIILMRDFYNINLDTNAVNIALILESVRALTDNMAGKMHPLTEFARTIIDLETNSRK